MAKKEEKKVEYEVEIISRTEVTTYPKIRQPVKMMEITYVTPGLPPATVWIRKDEWSIEKEKEVIRKDIERRLKFVPESYRV